MSVSRFARIGKLKYFDLSLAHASHRAQYREPAGNTPTVVSTGEETKMKIESSYEQIIRHPIERLISSAASDEAQRAMLRSAGTALSEASFA
jgi:hypothetical protein